MHNASLQVHMHVCRDSMDKPYFSNSCSCSSYEKSMEKHEFLPTSIVNQIDVHVHVELV